MSLFISFEGGEGCGKSTQSKALETKLNQLAIPVVLIYEPGSTPLGERVRSLIKQSGDVSISPLTELMLFNAARSQLVTDIIAPSLNGNKIVICDRFTDSTIAYQHYGRGLKLSCVEKINCLASQGIKPDITFLLDISPEVGLARKNLAVQDRFELEDLTFHKRVRQGFLKLAAKEPQRFVLIDATLSETKITGLIWGRVSQALMT